MTEPKNENKIFVASQWRLMWWKFRQHRLAMVGGIVVLLIYSVALFAEFLAPYGADTYAAKYTYAPPQQLHFIEHTPQGIQFRPYVYGYKVEIEPTALRRVFTIDESVKIPVQFFAKGEKYKMWNLFESDIHLIGPVEPGAPMYLLGADRMGRDMLSRVIYGTRVSMSIGLVGVMLSLLLGVILGGISGYYGGAVDTFIQRVIEFLRSIPTIPLWMGLAAALPPD
ncbi:MAG: ABC transporter permease, partial [Anaerolineae bacterium]|nr:ABC transporter permease [Anaerolineae bacterium]